MRAVRRSRLLGAGVAVTVGFAWIVAGAATADDASRQPRLFKFRTPSGLIVCGAARLSDPPVADLRCNIDGGLRPVPARPAYCDLEWAVGLEMRGTGRPAVVCASDPGFDQSYAPVLPYGRLWRHVGFTCRARPGGLTCRNRSSHGWFLSRNSWRVS